MNNAKIFLIFAIYIILSTICIVYSISEQNSNIKQLNDKLNNIETIIKDYPDDDYTIPEQLTGNYNLPKEN